MNQIEKLNILYGKQNERSRTAFKIFNEKFGFEFTDEETGEFLDSTDLDELFKKEDFKKQQMATKKPITAATERKEITVQNIPFLSFDTVGEKFTGKLLRKHTCNFPQGSKETYVIADDLGIENLAPTNIQLKMLLDTVANTENLPCTVEIEYTGTKPTAKGNAKQFSLYLV